MLAPGPEGRTNAGLPTQTLVESIVQSERLASVGAGRGQYERSPRGRSLRLILTIVASLLPATALGAMPDIRFSAASVEVGDVRMEKVRCELAGLRRFAMRFEHLAGPGETYLPEGLALTGALDLLALEEEAFALTARLESRGFEARLSLREDERGFLVRLDSSAQPLAGIARWPGLPGQVNWLRSGLLGFDVSYRQPVQGPGAWSWLVNIEDLGFDSPDGRFAGEGLDLELRGNWPDFDAAAVTLQGGVKSGELLIDDFYRDFASAGIESRADLRWNDAELQVDNFRLGDGDALLVDGRLRLDLSGKVQGQDRWAVEIGRLELDFPGAYRRYLEPMAAAWTLNGLEVTGHVTWRGQWASGDLVSGDLVVSDFSAVDTRRNRFAVTGLEAHMRPGDHSFDSRLGWRGLLLGRINLGAGEAALASEPGAVALLEPLTLEMLGGSVELDTLKVILPGGRSDGSGEPDVLLRARIHDLDMGEVTRALDWPEFTGVISGEIPGVSLDDGVLAVDGEIHFDVFGGRVALKNVSMERPFGVLPSLAADVTVTDLDLDQLTRTFSFGRIAGRLDGYVRDLRMLDWEPVAFEGWLGTPARQGEPNDISRQAVNHLTTIGGGSATAALTGPLMRMFSSFSYRRLGLGCHLQNNVCALRGLREDEASVLILEGAGVPKITIRAFNRSVDWPQMVANLAAVSSDNPVQFGKPTDP